MKDKFVYKGFHGSIQFSEADNVYFGKIENINDLITFEGENLIELEDAFKNAVEDYIKDYPPIS